MRFNRLYFGIAIAALIMVVAMSGCVSGGNPSQTATDAANATVDRMLASFNSGNYADFSANFSTAMLAGANESWFNGTMNGILSQYGKYVSRSPVPQATTAQGYNVFVYDCQFEKDKLKVQLTMNPSNIWTVEGLSFPPSEGKPLQSAMDAANATADRILASLNSGDYPGFTANFSATMLSQVSENQFNDARNDMLIRDGKYVSRSPAPQTMTSLGNNLFVYDCQFEKVKLKLQLRMSISDVWAVNGVLFSP